MTLFGERRKCKNLVNRKVYKHIQKFIRSIIRIAKNDWLRKPCEEVEQLHELHDPFNIHRKIKETDGAFQKKRFENIENICGKSVQNYQQRKGIWENYTNQLFDGNRSDMEVTKPTNLFGPSITKDDIRRTINTAKNRKATDPDCIQVELFKILDDNGITFLHKLFNKIYSMGNFPAKRVEQILSSSQTIIMQRTARIIG